jgi:hypothetical protein
LLIVEWVALHLLKLTEKWNSKNIFKNQLAEVRLENGSGESSLC